MDYLYQNLIDFKLVKLKNIVVLTNKHSAKIYLNKMFSYYTDCVIYSADNTFPENLQFSNYIRDQIETNEKLNILVIGADCFRNLTIKTNKILILDDILLSDFKKSKTQKIDFNEEKLQTIISSFFEQEKKIKLGYNFSNYYKNSKQFSRKDSNWIFDILVDPTSQNQ